MKNYLLLFIMTIAIGDNIAQQLDAEQIYKKVNNAVVQVYAYDSDSKVLSQGSGVVLNEKGWIVTNYHVYNGSDKLIVKHNEKIIEYSKIIGVDADKDILILKIADNTFPYVVIGNSDLLNVGQKIYAIGSPEGFENTITEGIISGLRSYEAHTQNYIQISAPISHGSSGGAIVNAKGELIGISALSSKEGQNLNFAIPVNEVIKVYRKEGVDETILSAENFFYKGMREYNAHNYDKAIEYYKKTVAINPNDVAAYNNLGLSYDAIGNPDAAISNYRKSIALNPNLGDTYYNLGVAYDNKHDYATAISNYLKAIALDTSNGDAYYNLAGDYDSKGDYATAISFYKKAIEIHPTEAVIYNNLGVTYLNSGDTNSAIYYYKKALTINPNHVNALFNLGVVYEKVDDKTTAISYYEKALAINPNLEIALYKLGLLYGVTNRDYNAAISCFKKAIAINANYAEAYFALGMVYGIIGDNYHYKLNQEKAYQLNPSLRK